MKKNKYLLHLLILLVLIFLITACGVIPADSMALNGLEDNAVGMANPSAVYCEGLRYAYESVERNGGMDADCILPDGTRCVAWDFLSGSCGQEFTHCEINGGTIEEGANIGTCRFADGSSCDEYQYFLSECSPGDQPGEISEVDLRVEEENAYPVEEETIEIKNFTEARDFLVAYFFDQYGIELTNPWIEEDISLEDANAKSTFRYVSGPLTIVFSAEASAPYAPIYEIEEASYLVNGFYWEGTLSFDGTIEESVVYPPGTILNEYQARDAILLYLDEIYGINAPGEWTEENFSPSENTTMIRVHTSDDWTVEVEFEPAAPLVSSYLVRVENPSEEFLWEGEITLRGEIEELSCTH